MAGEYVCTLDAKSLEKAKKELNEDPADRMNAVEAFRELIRTRAPHITCSTDTDFLLRFLRVAKFSQLEALKRLEKYLNMFNTMTDWIRDIDVTKPRVQAFLDTGYVVPLGFDAEGRRVNLYDMGALDPKSPDYDKKDLMQAMFGLFISQTWDEGSIVNGFTGLADLTHFGVKHQTYWTLDDFKRSADMMNGGFPARFKNFYYYNHGPIFEAIFTIFAPMVKKKIKDRLIMCGSNMEAIYDKRIAKHLLPVEYLPDDYTGPNNGTIKELVAKMKEELLRPEVVARLKYETSSAFRLDESKRPKDDVPLQSFRKLNVD